MIRLFLCLALLSGGARAQVGWAVSERVIVPRTDFPVTGPAPYRCTTEGEKRQQAADPVYQVQKRLSRWLSTRFNRVTRLQTEDNCADVCVTLPASAGAITQLQGYARAPGGPYIAPPWPLGPAYARWEEAVRSRRTPQGTRVCAIFHNHAVGNDYEVFLVVYYSF